MTGLFATLFWTCLVLRITMHWRGRKLAWVLAFAIIGVLVSFWGVNLVMYALCLDYKEDQVHIPFILQRRR